MVEVIKVKTGGGIFTLTKPVGKIGVLNFAILSSAASTNGSEPGVDGTMVMSPKDQSKVTDAFIKWTDEILPNIIEGGQALCNKLTGSDQWALFGACLQDMEGDTSEDVFKIVK